MTLILHSAFSLLALLGALAGAIYPFVVPGGAQAVFSMKAPGSLILLDGTTVGAGPIGQNFSDPMHLPGLLPANGPTPPGAAAPSVLFLKELYPAWANTVKDRVATRQHPIDPRSVRLKPACLGAVSAARIDPSINLVVSLLPVPIAVRADRLKGLQLPTRAPERHSSACSERNARVLCSPI